MGLRRSAQGGSVAPMALPWITVGRAETRDGVLKLRRRAADDWLLTIDGRVLMSSRAHRSEVALADLACAALAGRKAPTVLIGGLGMGFTLRAALDVLPPAARIVVAEITAAVGDWCAGELAEVSGHAVADPRVDVRIEDVAGTIATAAAAGAAYDAILLDLYEGPAAGDDAQAHPFYGARALRAARAALRPGGVLAVWAEHECPPFAARLRRLGFGVERARPGRGGYRHAVYVARLSQRPGSR